MAEDVTTVVRASIDAYNEAGRGPLELAERYDEFFAEDLEWQPAPGGPIFHGRQGYAAYAKSYAASFAAARIELGEIRAVSDEAVLALATMHVRGARSDVPIAQPVGWIFRVRDGRITGLRTHFSHSEAEEALRAEA